ncbi:unannotated protein [freshwater metagenome]|uniref:Unannotated protein n=1 Tax=freshwater metagenome TaxID=449393 RepID=A0A6J6SJL7_9ZZZZ
MIALIRTEFTKAFTRTRTLVIALILVALPVLISVAINARKDRPERGDHGDGLFRLATQSGLLVPAAVLSVTGGFLLVIIAGTLAADPISSDANWGNLRYLLMRPVGRGRLLISKAFVAGVLIWMATLLIAVAALVAGIVLFGWHDVAIPGTSLTSLGSSVHLDAGALLLRLVIGTAYVAFGFSALLALGTLFSTLTDTAAGAIGATVGVYIISAILAGITQLGVVRYAFPTYYSDAWTKMFTDNTYSQDMLAGIIVQVAYLVVFGTISVLWFQRKDIRS